MNHKLDFIKGLCQNSMVTEEVGPIWFSSSGEKIEARSNSIAVFDVTPLSMILHTSRLN